VFDSFRQAFRKRRCLIPADGFYEWRKTAKPKLPFAIAAICADSRSFIASGASPLSAIVNSNLFAESEELG